MAIFAIIAAQEHPSLVDQIRWKFTDNLKVGQGQWLISSLGTAKEVSDALGISDGRSGTSAIVVGIGSYYGRAPNNVWEWIVSKWS